MTRRKKMRSKKETRGIGSQSMAVMTKRKTKMMKTTRFVFILLYFP